MPLLALLAAAAQLGDRVDAAGLDPGEQPGGVAGRHRDAEPAVAVEHRRPRLVRLLGRATARASAPSCRRRRRSRPAGRHLRHLDGAGRGRPQRGLPGARVVAVDRRRRHVVGVAEPGLVAALGPLAEPGDRPEARQRHRAAAARRCVSACTVISLIACRVQAHSSVPPSSGRRRPGRGRRGSRSPRARPRRPPATRSVQCSYVGSVGRRSRTSRPRGRVAVGEDVDAARRGRRAATCWRPRPPARRAASARSSRPSDRSASHRSLRGAVPAEAPIDQPPAVHRHRDAVVVGLVQAVAEDLARRSRDRCPTRCSQTRRWYCSSPSGTSSGRDPAHVVEGLAAGHPGDGGVARAVDRRLDRLTGARRP